MRKMPLIINFWLDVRDFEFVLVDVCEWTGNNIIHGTFYFYEGSTDYMKLLNISIVYIGVGITSVECFFFYNFLPLVLIQS